MADNPEQRGRQDRDRVSADQPYEVEYLHRKFPHLSHEQILEAIKAKGPMRDDVMSFLEAESGTGKHGGQIEQK